MTASTDILKTTYTEDLFLIPTPPTVVIGAPWKDLTDEEKELLSKILDSVKIGMAAVRIVVMAELDLSQWKEKPSKLIGFGIKAHGIAQYELITTPQTQLVLADSLSVLCNNDELKKKLWGSLKQLFLP